MAERLTPGSGEVQSGNRGRSESKEETIRANPDCYRGYLRDRRVVFHILDIEGGVKMGDGFMPEKKHFDSLREKFVHDLSKRLKREEALRWARGPRQGE